MNKVPPKPKKLKGASRDELSSLDKNELIDRIIQLQAHNLQLKNIISKSMSEDTKCDNKNDKRPFDFSKCHYRKVLLRILYFGWDYQGLAVQEDSNQTIEHHLFHALIKSCLIQSRETSQYHRCGRTDKGVSAFGQVISITLRSKFPPETQQTAPLETEMAYCKILNRLLPKEIRAVAWMPVPEEKPEYSARFDCKKRQYKYYFPRSNLDLPAMRQAASHLIGSHDFRHLCKMDVGNGVTEFTRNILAADIVAVGEDSEDPSTMYCLVIEGNAFLWHQIRCIMAVVLLVGLGLESHEVVRELLDVESHDRKPQYNMALDVPLNLFKCSYDLEDSQHWYYDKVELRSVITDLQGEWTVYNIKTTMIKDTLHQLETEYSKLCASETDSEKRVTAYTDCLTQGVKARVYTPLMKRDKCSSLEEMIEFYKKKRKIT
ncbi:tRNA pseudouridine(38/39) synthase isoform X2 [Plodia interpunctella]|uniref:tRNA pseudouridine(38/39) synthase isoform X2 n=1 Tax=Plodia interpunctella TaxID=58824 RepID=UPI002367FD0D|nr:tRNA pseudouridine(38/39) synthase isoform X2 [Plodia interpunctella]